MSSNFIKLLAGASLSVLCASAASAQTAETVLAVDEAKPAFKPLRDLGTNPVIEIDPGAVAPAPDGMPSPQTVGLPAPQPGYVAPPPVLSQPAPQASRPLSNMMDMKIDELPSIADLVARVSQSTVNIIVTTEGGETTSEGQGSGFIISDKLEVVTNYHVIDGGTYIDIEFADGRKYPAEIIGTDEETDLALLQLKTTENIPHVDFHQSRDGDLRIGDWVVAIGNPFGIGQSTSLGVISAIGRNRVDSGSYVDYIQTDATINRGNSGGPLFNLRGDVVGVNSAIYSPTGASVGIAFVIPHTTAEQVIDGIRNDGRVRRGYLGAAMREATFEIDGRPGAFKAGATITTILPGSPADVYGLRVDDIILRINDTVVKSAVEATRAVAEIAPGEVAQFVYERDEKTFKLDVQIGERPEKYELSRVSASAQGLPVPPPPPSEKPRVNIDTGLQLLDLSPEFRKAIGMRMDQTGVYVESVTPGSAAERGGFKMGMVLLDADSQPIAEVKAFSSIILNAKLANQDGLVVNVRHKDGRETYMILPLD